MPGKMSSPITNWPSFRATAIPAAEMRIAIAANATELELIFITVQKSI